MNEVSHPDLSPLLDDLRRKRVTEGLTQHDIAERAGITQSAVSKLEKGKRSLRNMPGRELHAFLRAYGYNAFKIKAKVEEYDLQYPPQLADEDVSAPPGMVTVLYEGSISSPVVPPEPRRYFDATEGQFGEEELRVRVVIASDLITAKAKGEVRVRSRVWRHVDLPVEDGFGAIIRQDGTDALCIWPFTKAEYVTPLDPKSGMQPVLFEPDRIEVVSRVVAISNPHF